MLNLKLGIYTLEKKKKLMEKRIKSYETKKNDTFCKLVTDFKDLFLV